MSFKLNLNSSARKAGKRVTAWTFLGNGENIDVDVMMVTSGKEISFRARASHPLFRSKDWSDSDINALAKTVEQDIKLTLMDHDGTAWRDAFIVNIAADQDVTGQACSTHFTLKTTRAKLDIASRASNTQKLRLMLGDGQHTQLKEAAYDDNGQMTKMISADGQPIKLDQPRNIAVIEEAENAGPALENLERTLARFHQRFMERTRPDILHRDGLPTSEDLVAMMKRAANQDR